MVQGPLRLPFVSVLVSVGLGGALFVAYLGSHSQLAFAQGVDSVADVLASLGLILAIRISLQPPDELHPYGHHGAQPIAALLIAFLTAMLAVEVIGGAVAALRSGQHPDMDLSLAAVFTLKVGAKSAIGIFAFRHAPPFSPAIHAIAVDARNDVLVGLVALGGWVASRQGWAAVDAWLALPVGLWIAISGIQLGLENIRRLMGEAPNEGRQTELLHLARSVAGVVDAHSLRARVYGTKIEVWLQIVVDPEISVRRAHDIGEVVEARLRSEADVSVAVAHVDIQ